QWAPAACRLQQREPHVAGGRVSAFQPRRLRRHTARRAHVDRVLPVLGTPSVAARECHRPDDRHPDLRASVAGSLGAPLRHLTVDLRPPFPRPVSAACIRPVVTDLPLPAPTPDPELFLALLPAGPPPRK